MTVNAVVLAVVGLVVTRIVVRRYGLCSTANAAARSIAFLTEFLWLRACSVNEVVSATAVRSASGGLGRALAAAPPYIARGNVIIVPWYRRTVAAAYTIDGGRGCSSIARP